MRRASVPRSARVASDVSRLRSVGVARRGRMFNVVTVSVVTRRAGRSSATARRRFGVAGGSGRRHRRRPPTPVHDPSKRTRTSTLVPGASRSSCGTVAIATSPRSVQCNMTRYRAERADKPRSTAITDRSGPGTYPAAHTSASTFCVPDWRDPECSVDNDAPNSTRSNNSVPTSRRMDLAVRGLRQAPRNAAAHCEVSVGSGAS